jgi:hypothetical protein
VKASGRQQREELLFKLPTSGGQQPAEELGEQHDFGLLWEAVSHAPRATATPQGSAGWEQDLHDEAPQYSAGWGHSHHAEAPQRSAGWGPSLHAATTQRSVGQSLHAEAPQWSTGWGQSHYTSPRHHEHHHGPALPSYYEDPAQPSYYESFSPSRLIAESIMLPDILFE